MEPTAPTTFVDRVPTEEEDLELPVITEEAAAANAGKYFEAVGRRKEAVARVRMLTRKSGDKAKDDAALIEVNGKDYLDYFTDRMLQERVESPLKRLKSLNRFKVTAHIKGGGIAGQADALRHGISRCLELFDVNFRKRLKKAGFLTRDPRTVQRKMSGLKKARKAPRWSKR
ncbi:MAG TPA: 30S ribosomal protein S9 [Candidatus Paceibacterota bacterium]|nr:30S ribosomal protein S9 [Candidatus Paceibacterota bacterium]